MRVLISVSIIGNLMVPYQQEVLAVYHNKMQKNKFLYLRNVMHQGRFIGR